MEALYVGLGDYLCLHLKLLQSSNRVVYLLSDGGDGEEGGENDGGEGQDGDDVERWATY